MVDDNRLDRMRLGSTYVTPKNFVAPVFGKTSRTRDCDIVDWLTRMALRGDKNCKFVLNMLDKHKLSVNDLIVEGLLRLN